MTCSFMDRFKRLTIRPFSGGHELARVNSYVIPSIRMRALSGHGMTEATISRQLRPHLSGLLDDALTDRQIPCRDRCGSTEPAPTRAHYGDCK